MGTKPCPACNGSGESSNPSHPHCLGCSGEKMIDTPDPEIVEYVVKNWNPFRRKPEKK